VNLGVEQPILFYGEDKMSFNTETRLMRSMTLMFGIFLLAISQSAFAVCESSLKLEGTVSVKCCTPQSECISAAKAVYDYTESAKDDPAALIISLHASPWHLYDSEMRILTIADLAQMVKPKLRGKVQRIILLASWTGVAPNSNGNSLAKKLSDFLGGFPVNGMDGFVWIAKDGSVRTTQQAFTIKPKCPYGVHPGDEVMVSLVLGWHVGYEDDYIKKRYSEGIKHAGAAWEIFMLCPEKALQSFETAAKLSNPIAAYNAALMRLERGNPGDYEAAIKLLKKAVALGDKKSQTKLHNLKRIGH
jgi:hypothetical protein